MAKGVGVKITPQQFMAQWKHARHDFELNVHNFEVFAGKEAVQVFRGSFDMQRFNSDGTSKWPGRKWRKYAHPLLRETETLMNSITYKAEKQPKGEKRAHIFTDSSKFGTAARHTGFCYAAIHNEGGSRAGATGAAAHIKQRQFIGHSTVLMEKIKALEPMIFKGLPI